MQRYSSEAADTYRVSRRNEDNLLKNPCLFVALLWFLDRDYISIPFYTIGIVMFIAAKGKVV